MERLDQYLKRVGRALPRAERDDIVAELRASLLSRIDDGARAAGRPLTDAEVAELLRAFGHPLAVAGGFAHPAGLIPAPLVPFYRGVLAWTIAVIAAIHVALCIGRVLGPASVEGAIGRSIPGLVVAMLAAFTAVTLVFMALGRRASGARAACGSPMQLRGHARGE